MSEENIHMYRALMDWPTAILTSKARSLSNPDLLKLVEVEAEVENEYVCYAKDQTLSRSESQKDALCQTLTSLLQGKYELDARLLYAKVLFTREYFEDCLHSVLSDNWLTNSLLDRSKYDKWRQLRITILLASCFAIHGICLERTSRDLSRTQYASMEVNLAQSFRNSSELGVQYFKDVAQSEVNNSAFIHDWLVEVAVHRIPLFISKRCSMQETLEWYRRFLKDLGEGPTLRAIRNVLIRQYIDILVSLVREENYIGTKDFNVDGNIIPKSRLEECLFLLETAEHSSNEDVFLSLDPDHIEIRNETKSVYAYVLNIITMMYSRFNDNEKIFDSFKQSMKISFQDPDVWLSFALASMSNSMYQFAYRLLKECVLMENYDKTAHLLLSKIAIDHLGLYNEAEEHIRHADEAHCPKDKIYLHRSAVGFYKALRSSTIKSRYAILRIAQVDAYSAKEANPNDSTIFFFIALICAFLGESVEAVATLRELISIWPNDVYAAHLCVLIISSQKRYQEAFVISERLVERHPENMKLLLLTCSLKAKLNGYQDALSFLNSHLCDMKTEFLKTVTLDSDLASFHDLKNSLANLPLKDTLTLVDTETRHTNWTAKRSAFEIWMFCAEAYLSLDKLYHVKECIDEAFKFYSDSADLACLKGQLLEKEEDTAGAFAIYSEIINSQPIHCETLLRLSKLLMDDEQFELAKKLLRDAIRIDCSNYKSWHLLGQVLMKQDAANIEALKCLQASIKLENITPLLPYSTVFKPL